LREKEKKGGRGENPQPYDREIASYLAMTKREENHNKTQQSTSFINVFFNIRLLKKPYLAYTKSKAYQQPNADAPGR
jgi:hypothetical protein